MPITCPACTFENDDLMRRCEICTTPLAPLTWRCDRCGSDNDESLPECGLCQVTMHFGAELDVKHDELTLALPGTDVYYRCPHCGLGIENAATNCGIFICGHIRSHTEKSAQLPQHDEAYARAAAAASSGYFGCGKQFKLEGDRLVPCTGL